MCGFACRLYHGKGLPSKAGGDRGLSRPVTTHEAAVAPKSTTASACGAGGPVGVEDQAVIALVWLHVICRPIDRRPPMRACTTTHPSLNKVVGPKYLKGC